VSPAEVEAQLVAHPAVLEAGVVGGDDGARAHRPRACVVLKDGRAGSPALAAELREFVRARAAGFKAPSAIEFVPTCRRPPPARSSASAARAAARP
jgi:acyl-coenzyme A synthetase/AMP-(fatty) acid ligase